MNWRFFSTIVRTVLILVSIFSGSSLGGYTKPGDLVGQHLHRPLESGTDRIPTECTSFYDYVCEPEREDRPIKSYFEHLRIKSDSTATKAFSSKESPLHEPYEACVASGKSGRYGLASEEEKKKKKRAAGDYSFYDAWKMGRRMVAAGNVASLGYYAPATVSVERALNDSTKTCLVLSPNLKWLKMVKRLSKDPNSTLGEVELSFLGDILEAFERDAKAMSKSETTNEYEYLRVYNDGYAKIKDYENRNGLLADVLIDFTRSSLLTIPSVPSDASLSDGRETCLHLNGYEHFYNVLTSLFLYRTGNWTEGTMKTRDRGGLDTLDNIARLGIRSFYNVDSDDDVDAYWRYRCAEDLKAMAPLTFNYAYLDLTTNGFNGKETVDGVVEMIERLKSSMVEDFRISAHFPQPFKAFVSTKISSIVPFVLAEFPKASYEATSALKEETLCLVKSNGDRKTWADALDCLIDAKYRYLARRTTFSKARSEVDMHEERWLEVFYDTDVSIVNAWYDPTRNEITIPAGILQPPMYYGRGDPFDYARMGTILGHELGHSIDVHGLCWDSCGNFMPLTSRNDKDDGAVVYCGKDSLPEHYAKGAKCLSEDYGHPCDENDDYGDHTLGEDIADQVGLVASSRIFSSHFSESDDIRLEDKRDFYRRYAQLWCDGRRYALSSSSHRQQVVKELASDQEKHRSKLNSFKRNKDNALIALYESEIASTHSLAASKELTTLCDRVKGDVHALPKHRVNKTLRQIRGFARLFACYPGDPMVREPEPCLVY